MGNFVTESVSAGGSVINVHGDHIYNRHTSVCVHVLDPEHANHFAASLAEALTEPFFEEFEARAHHGLSRHGNNTQLSSSAASTRDTKTKDSERLKFWQRLEACARDLTRILYQAYSPSELPERAHEMAMANTKRNSVVNAGFCSI